MLRQKPFRLVFITTVLLFFFPLIAFSNVKNMNDSGEKRPDIVTIDIPSSPSHKDMPAVEFKHDLHSRVLEGQCLKCHEKKDDAVIFKFKRTEDISGQDFMDLYHDNCIVCHEEMKKAGETAGPTATECRGCHNANFKLESSWKKIDFDRSLHFRHESAKAIPSAIKTQETNCNVCHHSYNEKTKAIFYQKGEEEACVYCHKETASDGIRNTRDAAHDSCVVCHLQLEEQKIEAGPVDCKGCHTIAGQEKIKVIKDVPRLQRNQPDTVLLTGWTELGTDKAANEKIIAQQMDAVAFDHKFHESRTQNCQACHHKALEKCSSCHTDKGDKKGGYVKLDQAMHAVGKSQSCLGCHNELKKASECAGCHFQMPDQAFKDNACVSCHNVDAKAQPMDRLVDKEASANLAREVRETLANNYSKVSIDKIPEEVVINTIEDVYKPSKFPHRKVVQAIFEKVGDNAMAKTFHGNELTLCVGCHHNSPATLTPPKCGSCHGKTPDLTTGKPGLKGAYHGQCITCHQKMEVKSPAPTDCVKCHEKKAS
ncbi:MAG: cytochrome c3 family protein [Desulfobacteraceae bacterium]|nr:cytochrome c3 family protein [Desulfobacteraceae bacterium]